MGRRSGIMLPTLMQFLELATEGDKVREDFKEHMADATYANILHIGLKCDLFLFLPIVPWAGGPRYTIELSQKGWQLYELLRPVQEEISNIKKHRLEALKKQRSI